MLQTNCSIMTDTVILYYSMALHVMSFYTFGWTWTYSNKICFCVKNRQSISDQVSEHSQCWIVRYVLLQLYPWKSNFVRVNCPTMLEVYTLLYKLFETPHLLWVGRSSRLIFTRKISCRWILRSACFNVTMVKSYPLAWRILSPIFNPKYNI